MKYLILTHVQRTSYCIFKQQRNRVAAFSERELNQVLSILKIYKQYFNCTDILHAEFYRIERINLVKERMKGKVLNSPRVEEVATALGAKVVLIEQGELLRYGCCA